MKKMNRMEERILPCGRPKRVSIQSETSPFAKLLANLFVRKEAIDRNSLPLNPAWCSLYRRPFLQTLSYAPSKSMKVVAVNISCDLAEMTLMT